MVKQATENNFEKKVTRFRKKYVHFVSFAWTL